MTEKKIPIELLSKYRSFLMGCAIFSVMIFHFTDDCRIYNFHYDGWRLFFNRTVSSSGVDIFLLLSGIGLYHSFKKDSSLASFYKKRYLRILIPYCIVAIPALIWKYVFFNKIGFKEVLRQFFFVGLWESGNTWFWYIFMIALCYLIFPWIFSIMEDAKTAPTEQMRLLNLITFFTVLAIWIQNYDDMLFSRINLVLLRFPAFVFGCYLGKLVYEKRKISVWNIISFTLIVAVVYLLRETNRVMFVRYAVALLNMAVCFYSILILDKLQKFVLFKWIKKFFELLGKYSIELYLLHMVVRNMLCNYNYQTCHMRYYAIVVIVSVILSFPLKWISNIKYKKKSTKAILP